MTDASDSRAMHSGRPNALVRLLSSTWFGVALLALILVYASVGSALPQIRGALEMTEMQVFRHWLFATLVVLFCVALIVATWTRIRWNLLNAGALTVHTGLLLLTGGSFWYFSTKVEGDALLLSPRIELRSVDGRPLPNAALLAEKGQTWAGFLPAVGELTEVEVVGVAGNGSQPVATAHVRVRVGQSSPETVTLSTSGPSAATVGDSLQVVLEVSLPADCFYDSETPALYYRRMTESKGRRRAATIDGLPIYRERYLDDGYTLPDRFDRPVPSKRTSPAVSFAGLTIPTGWLERWRLPIALDTPGLPFDVEVTAYLPYVAGMRSVVRPGEDQVTAPTETGLAADSNSIREPPLTRDASARVVVEPVIEPLERRRPNISARGASAIRLKLAGRGQHAGWSEDHWIGFSQYPHIDAQPIRVQPPGEAGEWEFIYSRLARDLGAQLVPGKLTVTFFPGRRRVKAWRSDFFVQEGPAAAPYPAAVYTNQTCRVGNWTVFQSGAAEDHWSYTILGVGNRNGIWPMLLGCVLITLGCLYAFYVKPVLIRRRREGALTGTDADIAEAAGTFTARVSEPDFAEVKG